MGFDLGIPIEISTELYCSVCEDAWSLIMPALPAFLIPVALGASLLLGWSSERRWNSSFMESCHKYRRVINRPNLSYCTMLPLRLPHRRYHPHPPHSRMVRVSTHGAPLARSTAPSSCLHELRSAERRH